MDKTSLGDRMKKYEASSESYLLPQLPVVVRLDGRSFSKFTRGMKRPFDADFREAMIETSKYLLGETHAKIAYTQSDEITLLFRTESVKGQMLFDGRVQKICSVFAGLASARFLLEVQKRWPEKISTGRLPTFDCRVFVTPNEMEAYNAVLWREQDATKNSIQMVAQSQFSHKECMHKNTKELQAKLLAERDINWNDFLPSEKRGVYIRKEKVLLPLDEATLLKIPPEKRPKDGMKERNVISVVDMPPIKKLANAVAVLFNGEKPKLRTG